MPQQYQLQQLQQQYIQSTGCSGGLDQMDETNFMTSVGYSKNFYYGSIE